MIFLRGPHSNRQEDRLYRSWCDFSEVCSRFSPFSLHGFRKRAVLVLNDCKSEVEENWKCLESCSQILEETSRIQHPVQFTGRKQNFRQLRALESNIHTRVLVSPEMHFFLSTVTPISVKDNHSKTNLCANLV